MEKQRESAIIDDHKRTLYSRAFSKMDAGSLRGSTFSLTAAAVGAGVLQLPYVLKLNGYVLGTGILLLAAVGAIVSLRTIGRLAVENNCTSYSQLAK